MRPREKAFRIGNDYMVSTWCSEQHYTKTYTWGTKSSSIPEEILVEAIRHIFEINHKKYDIEFSSLSKKFRYTINGFTPRETVRCTITEDENKRYTFDTDEKYFDIDHININPSYLARKIETVRLLK